MPRDFPGASYDAWKTTEPAPQEEDRPRDDGIPEDIIVEFIYPPIPLRCFDYQACRADYEPPMPLGFGATPEEAINDLLANEEFANE
jgi:hypothetical protein